MNSEKEKRAFHIYQKVMDLPEKERTAFVASQTGDDEELRLEIAHYMAHSDPSHWASMEMKWVGKIEELVADAMAESEDTLSDEQQVGTYLIERKIGEGGMGQVYAAYDQNLQRPVALKLLNPMAAADDTIARRFLREARLLARLNHPNIVGLYGVEEWEGKVVLCLELVDGETLDKHISPDGMDLEKFVSIACQLADAIRAAHEAGVIHRDLKPANILVNRSGQVKVTDFGLARGKQQGHLPRSDTELTITEQGTIMGSFPYMSPEQVKGERSDTFSDLFSLGIVLFEMACGFRPFKGGNRAELMASILRDVPPTIAVLRPDFSAHIGVVVRRCLQKDPADRFASAAELARALSPNNLPAQGRMALVPINKVKENQQLVPTLAPGRKSLGLTLAVILMAFGLFALYGILKQRVEPADKQHRAPIFKVEARSEPVGFLDDEMLAEFLNKALSDLSDATEIQPFLKADDQREGPSISGDLSFENGKYHFELVYLTEDGAPQQFSQSFTNRDGLIHALGKTVWDFLVYLGFQPIVSLEDLGRWATTSSTKALGLALQSKNEKVVGNYEDALIKVKLAIEEDPYFLTAYVQKSELENVMGQREKALASITLAYSLRENLVNDRQRLTLAADYFLSITDFKKAAAIYRRLNNEYPKEGAFHSKLAQCYELLGKPARALYHFEKAVELSPPSESLRGMLMISKVIEHQQDEVLREIPGLRQGLGEHPHLDWAEVFALITSGSHLEAKRVVQEMINKASRQEPVYEFVARELLAKTLFLEGDLDGAIGIIEGYLPMASLQKEMVLRGRYFLSQLYILTDRGRLARRHWDQLEGLLAPVPLNIRLLKEAGRLALAMDHLEGVNRIQLKLERLAALYPTDLSSAAVFYLSGLVAIHRGDWLAAEEQLDQARSKCPDARTLFARAQIFEANKEHRIAFNLYREIVMNRKEEIIHRDFPDLWMRGLLAMERYFLFKDDKTGADKVRDDLSEFQSRSQVRQRLGQLTSSNL